MQKNNVLIVGSGAIGGFYGALLARAGAKVSVVCRSDYRQVKAHGILINSHCLGRWNFEPHEVFASVADCREHYDYVILCTKILPELDPAAMIKPSISPSTAIVFIQNGVEIESTLTEAFPDHEIISGLAFICCNRTDPGEIAHLAYGRLTLGNLPSGVSDKTKQLSEWFNQSGIECLTTDDVIAARWLKCVWNAPFNPLSVLSGGLQTKAILDTQEPLVRAIMTEIYSIAEAVGHPLPEDAVEQNIANTRVMPPYKTSMLLDFEQHRPLETEAIIGNAVRAAKREGVYCPHLETVYALLQLRTMQQELNPSECKLPRQ